MDRDRDRRGYELPYLPASRLPHHRRHHEHVHAWDGHAPFVPQTDAFLSLPHGVPPEDRYGNSAGQSYRPGNAGRNRSPPRVGGYRDRSPPRRQEFQDSYKSDTYRGPRPRTRSPPPRREEFRRRSRSPRFIREREPRGGDSYRGRARSPPPIRREDLPRDELFRREERDFRDQRAFRDERDRGYGPPPARSPPRYRERSPLPLKRGREASPVSSRGRRSPPLAKRERLNSPPRPAFDDYPPSRAVSPPRRRLSPPGRARRPSPPRAAARDYPRSRSPAIRSQRVDPRTVDDWRRRSPQPEPRPAFPLRDDSGQDSGATSRRSSPPIHPSRLALQPATAEERPRASPRNPHDSREAYRASDSDLRRPGSPPPTNAAYHEDRDFAVRGHPPREPFRQDEAAPPMSARVPPTGPGGSRAAATPVAPPSGPASTTHAVPSGPRGAGPPPSGPRGGMAPRGDFAPRGRGGLGGDFAPRGRGSISATFRGRGGPAPGVGRGESSGRGGLSAPGDAVGRGTDMANAQEPAYANRPPPSGPRGSFSQTPAAPAFRPSNPPSAFPPFSRSQRFASNGDAAADVPTGPKAARRPTEIGSSAPPTPRVHPSLADLPKLVDGGLKAESLVDRTKVLKLEEEAEKLRKQIAEKEARRRQSLREWDRMTREVELAALKSDLAEEALRELNGEMESQPAF